MRETGVVRKIAQNGRVVIPREILETMGLVEGSRMEIFTDNKNIVLRPCKEVDEWKKIKLIEPRLRQLEQRAAAEEVTDRNKHDLWSDIYKPQIEKLAGWEAENELLRTVRAYDVTVQNICTALRY